MAVTARPAPPPGFTRRVLGWSARGIGPASLVVGPVAVLALVVGLWEAGVWNSLFGILPFILPKPSEILHAFSRSETKLLTDLDASFKPAMLGYALGNGGGFLAAALLVALPKEVRRRVSGFFVAVQALPIIALAPLIHYYVGDDLLYKATVVAVLCFPSMMVFGTRGMTHLEEDVGLLMESYGARAHHMFLKVRVPNALPFAFTALRYTTVLALVGVTVTEVLWSRSGLGYEISNALQSFDAPTAWAAVVILGGLGVAWYLTLGIVERFALPWSSAVRTR
jgi:NitT/TauT family transport system permease protein